MENSGKQKKVLIITLIAAMAALAVTCLCVVLAVVNKSNDSDAKGDVEAAVEQLEEVNGNKNEDTAPATRTADAESADAAKADTDPETASSVSDKETDTSEEPVSEGHIGSLGIDDSHSEVPDEYIEDIRIVMSMSEGLDKRAHQLPDPIFDEPLTVGKTCVFKQYEYYDSFYSYDTSIATVSEKGIVTGVKEGVTYIVGVNRVHVQVFEVTVSP